MISLTDEENESYENQKFCYICKKRFTNDNKKVRDHCQRIFQLFLIMVFHNLLIVSDLYQLHCQVLLIIFPMDYIAINVQIANLVLTI